MGVACRVIGLAAAASQALFMAPATRGARSVMLHKCTRHDDIDYPGKRPRAKEARHDLVLFAWSSCLKVKNKRTIRPDK